jgi:hypothetical protein
MDNPNLPHSKGYGKQFWCQGKKNNQRDNLVLSDYDNELSISNKYHLFFVKPIIIVFKIINLKI